MEDEQSMETDGALPPRLAVEMQDELLAAGTELERLERLLSDAVDQLIDRFGRAHALCADVDGALPAGGGAALAAELQRAMTALQFQDMASQLITHSRRRLASVADCLGNLAGGPEDEGCEVSWVGRACPVAQRAVDAGSVELF
ncbi:MAG TPA: hypothetical protein VEA81_12405 [Burkholderiaceae bacterium]|nr:hypothetical protein [Burkholderiaceae bacterium]